MMALKIIGTDNVGARGLVGPPVAQTFRSAAGRAEALRYSTLSSDTH